MSVLQSPLRGDRSHLRLTRHLRRLCAAFALATLACVAPGAATGAPPEVRPPEEVRTAPAQFIVIAVANPVTGRPAAVGGRDLLLRLRARASSLAEQLEAAREETLARRDRTLRHARALALAAAAGAGLQRASWHVDHAVRELALAQTTLEQGALAQGRALDRLRLRHRAQQAFERWRGDRRRRS